MRQLLVAHAYWRMKGCEVDLVILCAQVTGYHDQLFQELLQAIRASESHALADKPGGIFLRKADQMLAEDRTLLYAAARVVLAGSRGSLKAQLSRPEPAARLPAALPPGRLRVSGSAPSAANPQAERPDGLLFANGFGGFTPDGREYCILPYAAPSPPAPLPQRGEGSTLAPPPAPWVNVIANADCGCLVSDSGLGCTWWGNSQLNRLTPWSNDPVSDPPSEVVYLRDEETAEFWTPTPRPLGDGAPTLVRHGQGYTSFEQEHRGLAQRLTVLVAHRRPRQADCAARAQPRRSAAAAVRDLLRFLGARHRARPGADRRAHRDRRGARRPVRAIRSTSTSAIRSPSPMSTAGHAR